MRAACIVFRTGPESRDAGNNSQGRPKVDDAANGRGESYPPVAVTRDIPLPRSISPEAQQKLAAMIGAPIPRGTAPEGIEAWEAMIRFAGDMLLAVFARTGSRYQVREG